MSQFVPIEDLVNMVVQLREPAFGGDKSGTGMLVVHKDRPFVLTAKHVASGITTNGSIVLKGAGDIPIVVPTRKLTTSPALDWQYHHEADLAALELRPQDQQTGDLLTTRFLPLNFFSQEKSAPSRDVLLTSIGFPLGLGTEGFFSPLTFESKASSGLLTLPRADTRTLQTFFVLANPSVGGYSGCPVVDTSIVRVGSMTTSGDGTCVYGVMHGTISDVTGGKLALVTPSFYVHELLARI